MRPQALEVFKILECTHGVSGAQTIIEYVENTDVMTIERVLDSKLEHLATKRDVGVVRDGLLGTKQDVGVVRDELLGTKRDVGVLRDDVLATKQDVALLRDELSVVRNDLSLFKEDVKNEFIAVRIEFTAVRNEFAAVRKEMGAMKEDLLERMAKMNESLLWRISDTRTELLRWMFIFWVSQVITTFGFILLFIKK